MCGVVLVGALCVSSELFVFVPSWLVHLCVCVRLLSEELGDRFVPLWMSCSFVQRVFTVCVCVLFFFLSERDSHP